MSTVILVAELVGLAVVLGLLFVFTFAYRRWRKTIPEGTCIPNGYGVAWDRFDPSHPGVICYPVPLNIIIGLAVKVYWALVLNRKFRNNDYFNFCLQVYHKGRCDGFEAGEEKRRQVHQEGLREGYARCRMVVCPHLRPPGKGDPNTKKRMGALAQSERRFDTCWGVVNPSNAVVDSIHTLKEQAEDERVKNAYAYVVVRVAVTPLYEHPGPPGVPAR
ncbi:MAG: hypothetical protein E3J81_03595 [Dehalococcoidia bacterium]|nr:MAG: hypothetical protein E3J81_03595 [Dehalococcoidia bacterium]